MEDLQTPGPVSPEAGDIGADERVERELVAVTWRNYGTSSVVEPFVAIAFAIVIHADAGPLAFAVWAAWAILAYSSRIALWLRWRSLAAGSWNVRRWGHIFHAHSFAAIQVWVGATIAFLPVLDPDNRALLIAIVCGVAGGGTILVSSYRPALITNIGGLMAALSVAAFLQPGSSLLAIGFLALIYGGYLISVGRNHHASLRQSLALRFERAAIIDRLEAALVSAEEANRSKSSFLANMSHELRTPLNAILGFSEALKDEHLLPPDPDRKREYAEHIHDSGNHLLNLVNDILDLSKAEAEGLQIKVEKVDLADMAETCLEMIRPVADKEGVRLRGPYLEGAAVAPLLLSGDALRIRQIFLNLLSNAVKFSAEGGAVTLSIGEDGDGGLIATVRDEGVGMDREQAERALQPFVQIQGVYSRTHQGTGLGLPITKTLVELHGGSLTIDSCPGEGTRAMVAFPASRRIAAAPDPAPAFVAVAGARPALF